MNLPELNQLKNDQSTYITFSKALLDFDKAIFAGTPCVFSKMVALNLPRFQNPDFFIDLSSIGIPSQNPNILLPKTFQYYMENIIRQGDIGGTVDIPEIAEIAFWKSLSKMGLSDTEIRNSVTFINTIATSNFVTVENNNGWGEIICQIPNKCKSLIPAWRSIPVIQPIVQCADLDVALYDNGLKQFIFDTNQKQVIDFNAISFDDVVQSEFDFNVLLLFYTDGSGIHKLHGINFIYPFENKVSYWDLETFKQKTNLAQTIGYQFKFNQKTCNNEASQTLIYELQEHSHWNTFAETLGKLNSFLEINMRNTNTER